MNHQNIPPPPQYPNHISNDITESTTKDNSVMENSVVYISDSGSPNYKSTSGNEFYHSGGGDINHIIPNLVNSINSTYQNLPPKSPKSNYRHINQNEANTKISNSNQYKGNPTIEYVTQNDSNFLYKIHGNPKMGQNSQWFMKHKYDWEKETPSHPQQNQQQTSSSGGKTRSHPNLMNDYVNLSGAEHLLNEIINSSSGFNRNARNGGVAIKPTTNTLGAHIGGNNQTHLNVFGAQSHSGTTVPSTPEVFRNDAYSNSNVTNHGNGLPFPDNISRDPENFTSESSRLVNLLLEENKRLRSKLRQSDTRVEVIDQLERKIHNLEVLFEELLTSQRRQRLLDLQLQQATSLSHYLSRNVISNQDVSAITNANSNSNNNNNNNSNNHVNSNNNNTNNNKSSNNNNNNNNNNNGNTNNNNNNNNNNNRQHLIVPPTDSNIGTSSTTTTISTENNLKSPTSSIGTHYQYLIPSSPVVTSKILAESPGGDSCITTASKQTKIDSNKRVLSAESSPLENATKENSNNAAVTNETVSSDPGTNQTSLQPSVAVSSSTVALQSLQQPVVIASSPNAPIMSHHPQLQQQHQHLYSPQSHDMIARMGPVPNAANNRFVDNNYQNGLISTANHHQLASNILIPTAAVRHNVPLAAGANNYGNFSQHHQYLLAQQQHQQTNRLRATMATASAASINSPFMQHLYLASAQQHPHPMPYGAAPGAGGGNSNITGSNSVPQSPYYLHHYGPTVGNNNDNSTSQQFNIFSMPSFTTSSLKTGVNYQLTNHTS